MKKAGREWVDLTDQEIEDIWYPLKGMQPGYLMRFARAIEAKLKEKNK